MNPNIILRNIPIETPTTASIVIMSIASCKLLPIIKIHVLVINSTRFKATEVPDIELPIMIALSPHCIPTTTHPILAITYRICPIISKPELNEKKLYISI